MRIVLYTPEIPPNTGSVARLCAATRTPLHLIEPLGFSLDDKYLKRAGLDYWPHVDVSVWPDFASYLEGDAPGRVVLSSARRGEALGEFGFRQGDAIVLGPETKGLPDEMFESHANHVRLPIWGEVRSINMAQAAAVLLYDAYRQLGVLSGR
ncbi:tRNA (cytidine(34)-2'-O)-methyltransferase [Desulfohalovibrio reitneri]|uniref:tRNA (cytidine(34)-2'-O)-methyltransferase n=1 Tax=Desulfohalovibrio reitneri TaxID=1307759 RepID=UPI0004A6BC48|nr:tRNA (cytidine(34)-2'-O)-methyltransferase [Desulfohalovibrio reitneri]